MRQTCCPVGGEVLGEEREGRERFAGKSRRKKEVLGRRPRVWTNSDAQAAVDGRRIRNIVVQSAKVEGSRKRL